jgi:hypothetical protein
MEIIITLIKIAYQSRGVWHFLFSNSKLPWFDLSSSDAHFTLFTNTDLYTASVLWFFNKKKYFWIYWLFITNGDVLPNQILTRLATRSRLRDSIKAREPHMEPTSVCNSGWDSSQGYRTTWTRVAFNIAHITFFFMWFFRQSYIRFIFQFFWALH